MKKLIGKIKVLYKKNSCLMEKVGMEIDKGLTKVNKGEEEDGFE